MESNRELFETYNKDVYRTCYYMVHDAADAEDLTQDVFITVFRSNREHVEHIKAWIMKITVNHCLNHLKRKRTLQQKITDNLHFFNKTAETAVEQQIEQRETEVEWAQYMVRSLSNLGWCSHLGICMISVWLKFRICCPFHSERPNLDCIKG